MLDENFDAKIKQKLESIKPDYDEKAWHKFKKVMPVPWYKSLLHDYGAWVYGGVTTVALLSTYLYNENLKKENNLLNDKITTIETKSESKNSKTTDTVFVEKIKFDTVFITKYIYRKIGTNTDLKNIIKTKNKGITPTLNTADEWVKQKFDKRLKSTVEAHNEAVENVSLKPGNKESLLPRNNVGTLNKLDDKQSKTEPLKPENIEGKLQAEATGGKSNLGEIGVPQEKRILETPKETNTNALVMPERVAVVNNFEPKEDFKKPFEGTKTEDKPSNPSSSKMKLSLGLLTDLRDRIGSGLGPIVEFFINDKWSINTGMLFTQKNKIDFHQGSPDFAKNTGKDFEDHYHDFIPVKPDKIGEIGIQTQFVKMPLFVNYHLPLKHGFSFLVSSGTKLNLKMIEKVNFESSDYNGMSQENNFVKQSKTKVFNNWFYGMGIQYKYGKMIGEIVPFFEFPFKKDPNITNAPPQKYGVNASMKFVIK